MCIDPDDAARRLLDQAERFLVLDRLADALVKAEAAKALAPDDPEVTGFLKAVRAVATPRPNPLALLVKVVAARARSLRASLFSAAHPSPRSNFNGTIVTIAILGWLFGPALWSISGTPFKDLTNFGIAIAALIPVLAISVLWILVAAYRRRVRDLRLSDGRGDAKWLPARFDLLIWGMGFVP